ncbi:protein BatD [bacterium]|nr:protein BatD [bacterium]
MKYILLTTLLFSTAAANAQVEVIASINKRVISINENVNFQVMIEGSQNASKPVFEKLQGFDLLQGPSTSTQMSFVNGRQSKSITFSYILRPKLEGTQSIGPVAVKVGSQKYRTKPILVEVVKGNKKNDSSNISGDVPKNNFFLNLQADKTKAYVNGQIALALTLYYKDTDITDVTQPDFNLKGFFVYDDGSRPAQQRVMIDNVIYQSVRFQKLLIPLKSGKQSIGPFYINITIRVPVHRDRRNSRDDSFFGGSIFGNFFGNYKTKVVTVKSNPLTFNIKKIPEADKPKNYNGAVGEFSLNASVSPSTIQVGEPVTLTVELSGQGNIDNASVILPTNTANFKIYEPETTRDTRVSDGQLIGKRTYKQAMVPTSINANTIPAISFSYFNVDSGKYVSLQKGPFKLKVEPAPDSGKIKITELVSVRNGQGSIRILNQDIFPIKISVDSLSEAKRTTSNPLFYIMIFGSSTSWAFLALIAKRRHRMLNDTALYRRTNASKLVKSRLRKAHNALKSSDNKLFYLELSDALTHYIADKIHIPAQQVTGITLSKILIEHNVSESIIEETKRVLDYCDFGRFAPSEFSKEAAIEKFHESEKLISKLDKEIS